MVAQRYLIRDHPVCVRYYASADKGDINVRRTPVVVERRLTAIIQQDRVKLSAYAMPRIAIWFSESSIAPLNLGTLSAAGLVHVYVLVCVHLMRTIFSMKAYGFRTIFNGQGQHSSNVCRYLQC